MQTEVQFPRAYRLRVTLTGVELPRAPMAAPRCRPLAQTCEVINPPVEPKYSDDMASRARRVASKSVQPAHARANMAADGGGVGSSKQQRARSHTRPTCQRANLVRVAPRAGVRPAVHAAAGGRCR